jgi:endonuclease YncB( thermonuclease family)
MLSGYFSLTRLRDRKRILFLLVLILIAAYLAKGYFLASEQRKTGSGALPPYLLTEHWLGHVQEIINPHTLSILSPYGETIIVRLYGIKAPLLNEPGGSESRSFLAGMINEEMVTIIPFMEDNRGQLIANVYSFHEGLNLSEELVRRGLAAVSRDYCRQQICMYWFGLEEDARRQQSGMWIESR